MNFNFCLTVFHFDHLSNSIVFNMLTPDDLCYAEFFTLRAGGWEFHPFFGKGQRLPTLISLRSPTQRWRGCFDGCAGSIIWESAPCSSNRPFLLQTFLVTTKLRHHLRLDESSFAELAPTLQSEEIAEKFARLIVHFVTLVHLIISCAWFGMFAKFLFFDQTF